MSIVLIQENILMFSGPKEIVIINCLHICNNHKAIIFSGQNYRFLFQTLQNSGDFVCRHSLVFITVEYRIEKNSSHS